MNDVVSKYYMRKNDMWGKPQIFKNVLFYPIQIIDTDIYDLMTVLLSYNKMAIPDKTILKMSYLKFLLIVVQSDKVYKDVKLVEELKKLLEYITHEIVDIQFLSKKEELLNVEDFRIVIKINETIFTENDFENIREIILEQNNMPIEYINEYIPDLEKALSFHYKSFNSGNFEEQLFSYCAYVKKCITDNCIQELTYYQYFKSMERVSLLSNYEIMQPLVSSGQVEFKKGKLEHWLSHVPKRGRYSDILIAKEEFVKESDIFKVSKNK